MVSRTAVVFAYHNVGVSCLAVLLAKDINIKLVVTHEDSPEESIWFASVAALAKLNNIKVITPSNPNTKEVIQQIRTIAPEWLFSFYYRHMLTRELLSIPRSGAFNMHGSLLPKYRGRAPVNWCLINGETETGASLHRMEDKPDAGALIDQQSIPVLPNETAAEVLQKVVCAAQVVMLRSLPRLVNGVQSETLLDLYAGSYFGGRTPEDSRIDWRQSAQQIHNLIRAVAPPFPAAFFDIDGRRIHILGSYYRGEAASDGRPQIYWLNDCCYVDCHDGKRLTVTRLTIDQQETNQTIFKQYFGDHLFIKHSSFTREQIQ